MGFYLSDVIYEPRQYTYIADGVRSSYPITIDEIKSHLKIDIYDDDQLDYLNLLISAAVEKAEQFTNRSFINQTWVTYRDSLLEFYVLEKADTQSVSHVKILNKSNEWITLTSDIDYCFIKKLPYGEILMSKTFDINSKPQSIEIKFVAGYGTASDVPAALKLTMLQHLAFLYENKGNCGFEETPPLILSGYRDYRVLNLHASMYL